MQSNGRDRIHCCHSQRRTAKMTYKWDVAGTDHSVVAAESQETNHRQCHGTDALSTSMKTTTREEKTAHAEASPSNGTLVSMSFQPVAII